MCKYERLEGRRRLIGNAYLTLKVKCVMKGGREVSRRASGEDILSSFKLEG